MYQNLPNICYECGIPLDKAKLTKEHVPPKCFFPKSDRSSLITIPSCEEHNGGKSDDDEHLLQMISIQILANDKEQDIGVNKALRGLYRNKKKIKSLASTATLVYFKEKETDSFKQTFAFKFDEQKFDKGISSICKGLYYYEFHKVFNGDIKIYNEFKISLDDNSIHRNKTYEENRALIKKCFSNIEKKGENQSIFYYQVLKGPQELNFSYAIRLCFYEGIGILAFLKEKKNFKLNALTAALYRQGRCF